MGDIEIGIGGDLRELDVLGESVTSVEALSHFEGSVGSDERDGRLREVDTERRGGIWVFKITAYTYRPIGIPNLLGKWNRNSPMR